MRPPVLALICSVAAVGVGFAIIPPPLERLTMLTRDKDFEKALQMANEFVEAGEASPEMLMQAFQLNERYGDLARATGALQAYLALRPDDVKAWRKAARFYENANRSGPQMEALEAVVRLTGEAATARWLTHLYRLHARFADELRVLQTIAPDGLDEEHGVRLASLLISDGQLAEASDVLYHLNETLSEKVKLPRLLLFDVLVERGRIAEALHRANGWLANWRDADSRVTFVRHLLQGGADAAAFQLASEVDGSAEPAVMAQLFDVLSRERRMQLLRDLVGRWVDQADAMSPERLDGHLRQVVAIAAERGMEGELFRHLIGALHRHNQPGLQAGLIEALLDRFGYAAIMPYRAALTPEVLTARPVLAARLFLAEGNLHAARHFLILADLKSAPEQTGNAWLAAAREVLAPEELLAELLMRARSDRLPTHLLRPALDLAASVGGPAQVRELWAIVRGRNAEAGET